MYITILQVGKTKDSYIEEGEEKFLTMLRGFAKLEMLTVKDDEQLRKHLTHDAHDGTTGKPFTILLERTGKELSSEEFSKQIGKLKYSGQKILFVIGGPYGIPEDILKKADLLLSFSRLTFTHQMIRLILLEQIYRAFTIITGKSYHY